MGPPFLPTPLLTFDTHVSLAGTGAQPYQWSCSARNAADNFYTIPGGINIGGDEPADFIARYPGNFSEVSSQTDTLLIYRLPTLLNCSGFVSRVGFCYQFNGTEAGVEQPVFTLFMLERSGPNFTIISRTLINNTPSEQNCVRGDMGPSYCCDTFNLSMANQFQLPTSNFAFGILPLSSDTLLRFDEDLYPQFVVKHVMGHTMPDVISVTNTSTLSSGLILFQFYISEYFWYTYVVEGAGRMFSYPTLIHPYRNCVKSNNLTPCSMCFHACICEGHAVVHSVYVYYIVAYHK